MRYLVVILMLLPVLIPAPALAQVSVKTPEQTLSPTCVKPDQRLITVQSGDIGSRFGDGRISKKYDEQVNAFNACMRSYLDNADREITRLRTETKARRDQISQTASDRIRRIERQIGDALQAISAAQAWKEPPLRASDVGLDAFPDPECKAPDAHVLDVRRGAKDDRARQRQYEAQIQDHTSCMQLWIAQGRNEISQIKIDAEAELKKVTADANRKVGEISASTQDAAKQADIVQREQGQAVAALRTALGAGSAAVDPLTGGSLTKLEDKLQRSQDTPTGAGAPEAITCRTRQPLADSRLLGPEICKRNRVWAELYKAGQTISADGQKIVNSEKGMTLGPVTDGR